MDKYYKTCLICFSQNKNDIIQDLPKGKTDTFSVLMYRHDLSSTLLTATPFVHDCGMSVSLTTFMSVVYKAQKTQKDYKIFTRW